MPPEKDCQTVQKTGFGLFRLRQNWNTPDNARKIQQLSPVLQVKKLKNFKVQEAFGPEAGWTGFLWFWELLSGWRKC
jgi:hypothetical protein